MNAFDTMRQAMEQWFDEWELILPPDARQAFSAALRLVIEQAERQEPAAVHQYRVPHCSDWYDGIPDHHDGHGPYEVRTLYAAPPSRQPLTDEEIDLLKWHLSASREYEPYTGQERLVVEGTQEFARAVERKHGIAGEA